MNPKPPSLTPALKLTDGRVLTGGLSHAEIATSHMNVPGVLRAFQSKAAHIFVDQDGNELNREQAREVLAKMLGVPESSIAEPVQSWHIPLTK
jgi:dihydroxyacetone kinase DhaKLM complex PTS-EIIA-like component DhaM